jgi:predicted unusual protein kinase regulating ubiquinone biosynthesis (AarF/ABC1/UbiB family)
MAFVSKTPSLQKVAQILARNQALSSDYREALQQFENDIHTMTAEELVQFIREDVGQENINKYQVEFADTILAEGSVGAVIRATAFPPVRQRSAKQSPRSLNLMLLSILNRN